MEYSYLFYIVAGFISGSILFGRIIPLLFKNIDVTKDSDDGNPGAFNAFTCGGPICGLFVLLLDLLKGSLPVLLCISHIGTDSCYLHLSSQRLCLGMHTLFLIGEMAEKELQFLLAFYGLLPICRPPV